MKIHHIAITVTKIETSIIFYRENFGGILLYLEENLEKKRKLAMIQLENCHIELREFADMKHNQDVLHDITIRGIRHIAFQVDNIQQEVTRLQKNGLVCTQIKESSIGGYFSFTVDPDGVAIELYELPH